MESAVTPLVRNMLTGSDIIAAMRNITRTVETQAVGGVTVDIVVPCKWKFPYLADAEWAQVCMDAWTAVAEERGLSVIEIGCGDCYIHVIVRFPAYAGSTVSSYVTGATKAAKAAVRERFGSGVFGKTAGTFFTRTYLATSVGRRLSSSKVTEYLDSVCTQYSDKPYG